MHAYATSVLLTDVEKPQIAIFADHFGGHDKVTSLDKIIVRGMETITKGTPEEVSGELNGVIRSFQREDDPVGVNV